MSLRGKGKVKANLEATISRAQRAAASGLYTLANLVITDAKRRSPVDTGTMRSSAYVTLPEVSGDTVRVEAGFGGPSEDYVVVQHEDLSLKHAVGEPKFLENAFDAAQPTARADLERLIKQAFDANTGTGNGTNPTVPE